MLSSRRFVTAAPAAALATIGVLLTGCTIVLPGAEPPSRSAPPAPSNSTDRATAVDPAPSGTGDVPESTAATPMGWQTVLERHKSSVLRVYTSSCDAGPGVGTGFVVGDDLVMTAAHVVDEASMATIQLSDGTSLATQLVAVDEGTDSALLRTSGPLDATALDLAPGYPTHGAELVLLGYPFNEPSIVMSDGLVSALHHDVDYGDRLVRDTFITNAATNPGNSGGPALDASGNVIGLVSGGRAWSDATAGRQPVQGINYVVPSNLLTQTLSRSEHARAQGFTPCADDPDPIESGGIRKPALEVTTSHRDATSVAGTLYHHGLSINGGYYQNAWRMFTPRLQSDMKGLTQWSSGLKTSYWTSIVLSDLSREGDVAQATVSLTTQQDPAYGFENQSCSQYRMRYRMVLTDGTWLMDHVDSLRDPAAC